MKSLDDIVYGCSYRRILVPRTLPVPISFLYTANRQITFINLYLFSFLHIFASTTVKESKILHLQCRIKILILVLLQNGLNFGNLHDTPYLYEIDNEISVNQGKFDRST